MGGCAAFSVAILFQRLPCHRGAGDREATSGLFMGTPTRAQSPEGLGQGAFLLLSALS